MLALLAACSGGGSTGGTGAGADDPVLVVPDGEGLALRALDGSVSWSKTWDELLDGCAGCGGEGANSDGDGLLVAYTAGGGPGAGGIARLDASFALDFRLDGLAFPHAAVRDPSGDVVVAETSADRLIWLEQGSTTPVRTLEPTDLDAHQPNGLHRLDYDGRTLLLASMHGSGGGPGPGGGAPPGSETADGALALWDATDPDAPVLAWRFPETGHLNTPHGPILREVDGRWLLLYAHSFGDGGASSSIGVASLDDPTSPPVYLADLVPADDTLGFLRGVELDSDGTLYLTDSGPPQGATGRILTASLPDLAPAGASGAYGDDQVFVELPETSVIADGLAAPFEGWLR